MPLRHASPAIPVAAALAAVLVLTVAAPAFAQRGERALVPPTFNLRPAVTAAVEADWLSDDERRQLRLFHGVYDEPDLDTPARRAQAAVWAWRLDDPALGDPEVPATIRAEALALAGEYEIALETLDGETSLRAQRLRAEALEALGRGDEADAAVDGPLRTLTGRRVESAGEMTDGVLAMLVRARVRGQPSRDHQTMLTLLAQAHQDLDRFHWPSRLVEGMLLLEKDDIVHAVEALHETLELNPRSSEAWFALGEAALSRFDFGGTVAAATALRRTNPEHPLAAMLLAGMALVQDDPETAARELAPVLDRYPRQRRALAIDAAIEAMRYDDEALVAALERFDALSPGNPAAHFEAGRYLSLRRQYGLAAELLEEAVRRRPAWPPPRIELGLLEMQSGRDDRARAALERAFELDPFNRRAINSLNLLRQMDDFVEIETEYFRIRYKPGVDEVIARMMPEVIDEMHEELVQRFQHEPSQKTVLEMMPDHRFFSVRITGMPWIHTVAACTGPVIAMEVPREGPPHLHLGPYDWLQVLRHEYVHTITLSQTRNRIPHWLTEAAAVSAETAPRAYETAQMLAREWQQGTLFDLDGINWAFVRPRRPQDRSLAYAQGHWMVEYLEERFGEDALVRLIDRYFDGVREDRALPEALGISRDEFLVGFLEWAGKQVNAWGLDARPSMETLTDTLRDADPRLRSALEAARQARVDAIAARLTDRIGMPSLGPEEQESAVAWPAVQRPPVTIDDLTLERWLAEHPEHPDLLELQIRRIERARGVDESLVPLLERYMRARPVDPYPHLKLAQIHLEGPDPQRAVPHLQALDDRELKDGTFAIELARLHREAGRYPEALASAQKAVRINPYDAATRELAAAVAIEAARLDTAQLHLEALVTLEPQRSVHERRLEALKRLRTAS